MTWAEWKEALLVVSLIAAGVALFGIVIWRIAKHDEEDRRVREEGEAPTDCKVQGKFH